MSKYSVGVYRPCPGAVEAGRKDLLRRQVADRPAVPVSIKADGDAVIETYTVRYDWPVRTGSSSDDWTTPAGSLR